MSETETLYATEAVSTGAGRSGHVATRDGALDADLKTPEEMGGPGDGLNPESLFAAGYSACFHSALLAIARGRKIDLGDSAVGARVSLQKDGEGNMGLAVGLEVVLPDLSQDEAQEIADEAHQMCPYSRATRGNIEVTVTVTED